MRRFARLAFNISAAVSSLVMLAALVLWVRSYYVTDTFVAFDAPARRFWFFSSGLGRTTFFLMTNSPPGFDRAGPRWLTSKPPNSNWTSTPTLMSRLGFRLQRDTPRYSVTGRAAGAWPHQAGS